MKGMHVTTGSFKMNEQTLVLKEDLSGVLLTGSSASGWLARSGHVPLGYFKDAEKTAKTFPVIDGVRYAVPGDHAKVAEDGTIVVLGRGSVSINSGGEKIYPEEVEKALKHHPSVYDAVVVGTPNDRFGQQVTQPLGFKELPLIELGTIGQAEARHEISVVKIHSGLQRYGAFRAEVHRGR